MIKAIDRLIELDEQEVRKQRERTAFLSMMDAIVEALPDALIVSDAEGKIVLFNKRAELMFGYHRSKMIGDTVEKLLPPAARAHHLHRRQLYSRFSITDRVRRMGNGTDLVAMHSDGHQFPLDITLSRMAVPNGIYSLALARYAAATMDAVMPERAAFPPESTDDVPHA